MQTSINAANPPANYPYPSNYIVPNPAAATPSVLGGSYTPITISLTPEEYWAGMATTPPASMSPSPAAPQQPVQVQQFPVPFPPSTSNPAAPAMGAAPASNGGRSGGIPAWVGYLTLAFSALGLALPFFRGNNNAAPPAASPPAEAPAAAAPASPATPAPRTATTRPSISNDDTPNNMPTESPDETNNTPTDRNTPVPGVLLPATQPRGRMHTSTATPAPEAAAELDAKKTLEELKKITEALAKLTEAIGEIEGTLKK
jgi:hypothetical protein